MSYIEKTINTINTLYYYLKSSSNSSFNPIPWPSILYYNRLLMRLSHVTKKSCSIVSFEDIWYFSKSINASMFTSSMHDVKSSIKKIFIFSLSFLALIPAKKYASKKTLICPLLNILTIFFPLSSTNDIPVSYTHLTLPTIDLV